MYYDQAKNTFYFLESNLRYDLLVFYSRDDNEFIEYGQDWNTQQSYIYNLDNLLPVWLKHNFKHDQNFYITVTSWLNNGAKLIFLTDNVTNLLNNTDATPAISAALDAYQGQISQP